MVSASALSRRTLLTWWGTSSSWSPGCFLPRWANLHARRPLLLLKKWHGRGGRSSRLSRGAFVAGVFVVSRFAAIVAVGRRV